MDASAFEAAARAEGYQPVRAERAANEASEEHAHGFDAKLFILEGEITITRGGVPQTFRPGEMCAVPAGERHEERVGPERVRYIIGRRSAKVVA